MIKQRIKILSFLIITVIVLAYACTESINDQPVENRAPDTFLFLYPDSGTVINQQKSRLQVHWWSDDPDGLVIGYYFQWEGLETEWKFTTSNDSIFSLPIGTVDTNFTFRVMAADIEGNGIYDNSVIWNGEDIGPEPFIDVNNNGIYDEGEFFYDIGLIDPTPAEQNFPIKNSPPEIEWNELSILPLESFPVTTVGWNAVDLDGDESIVKINLALNDTTDFVTLPGNVRLVTLRSNNYKDANPTMQILINGSESNIFTEELRNLLLDANNRLFVRAVDISGSSSPFVPLPDTSREWFVKKPKGNLLIIDDYGSGTSAADFYTTAFDNLNGGSLAGKYDVTDIENSSFPYENITFLETLKLFDFVFWYSDDSPRLELANLASQKYINQGGKIAYSMTFRDSSSTFDFDISLLQNFLPIDSLGQNKALSFLLPNANILKSDAASTYPNLRSSSTIGFVRTYHPNLLSATEVYDLSSSQLNGNIALLDNSKSLFFIGLPLHQCDAVPGSVGLLLEKIFFEEFGMSL